MQVYNERLQSLGARAEGLLDDADTFDEARRDAVYCTLLAATFDYQVKNGGFDQLIVNVGKERMEQFDLMLQAVNAEATLGYWRRAMYRCVEDLDEFRRFLDVTRTRPGEPNPIGVDLLALTVEYLQAGAVFDTEIEPFLDHAEALV